MKIRGLVIIQNKGSVHRVGFFFSIKRQMPRHTVRLAMIVALTHVRDWQKFISRDLHATEIACLRCVYPETLCLDGSVCHPGPAQVSCLRDIRQQWLPLPFHHVEYWAQMQSVEIAGGSTTVQDDLTYTGGTHYLLQTRP